MTDPLDGVRERLAEVAKGLHGLSQPATAAVANDNEDHPEGGSTRGVAPALLTSRS